MASGASPIFDSKLFFAKMRTDIINLSYAKGDIVFEQGERADAVFFLQTGKIKIAVLSATGKEAVVGLLSAGEFFGEGCLAGQLVRMGSVVAMTACSATRIEKAAMIRLIQEEPDVSKMFVEHLLARNVRIESDLVDHLFNSSEKRLARLLLILANFGKQGKPETIISQISQETLAEMVGTTRSRVSYFMNKFRELGFIDYNGHIEVHSSLLSVVLNDSSESDEERPMAGRSKAPIRSRLQ